MPSNPELRVEQSCPCLVEGPRPGAPAGTALVASLAAPVAPGGDALRALPSVVGWLQVRADRVGDVPPSWLRDHFAGRLLYSLRSRAEGGHADPADPRRRERLLAAVAGFDLIELEGARDLGAEVLGTVPPEKRFLTWRGPAADVAGLEARFRQLAAVPSRFYQVVVPARRVGDGLLPLAFLHAAGRRDVVAFADGERGFWSRVLAPFLGAPLVFGTPDGGRAPADDPPLERLMRDYGLPELPVVDRIYGIIGDPVAHSLSPRLHNAAYRALDERGLYLPFEVDSFAEFWNALVAGGALERLGLPLRGITVVAPHKEAALAFAAVRSPAAERAISANLLYARGEAWTAETTDSDGVLSTLGRRGLTPAGRRVAVVGCGGSGRAMAHALDQAGADVTLVNRGRARGQWTARRLGLPLVPLSRFSVAGFDVVVNATPVGRQDGAMPFAVDRLGRQAVVVDLVYATGSTPLVAAARARQVTVIEGREILWVQARRQFARMTGRAMPRDLAAGLLGLEEPPGAEPPGD